MRDAREQLGRHRVALVGDEQVGMVDRVEPHLMREAIRHTQAHSQAPSAAITGSAWSTEESRADPLPPAQSPVIRSSSGGHQEESRTDPFTSRAWKVSLSRGRETRHRSDCATDPGFVKSVASSQRAHASTCESVSRRAITSSKVIRGHQRPSAYLRERLNARHHRRERVQVRVSGRMQQVEQHELLILEIGSGHGARSLEIGGGGGDA